MAAGYVGPTVMHQFFDDDGLPLAGGLLYTYAAGGTTPQAVYSDAALLTPLPNPVVLDASGRAAYYMATGVAYKLVLQTSDAEAVWTQDNVELPGLTLPAYPGAFPTGGFMFYPRATGVSGFLLCDGSVVAQASYAALFAICGTLYNTSGEGDGNFRLPNMVGRFPLGKTASGTGSTLGASGGAIDHTHSIAAHHHVGATHTHPAGTSVYALSFAPPNGIEVGGATATGNQSAQDTGDATPALTVTGTGNPPFLSGAWYIKT